MSNRVYLLLNITEGKSEEALRALRGKSGVVVADLLEDNLGILVMLQATNRPKLAKLTVESISAIEQITENVSLLPTRRINKNNKSNYLDNGVIDVY
jgi:hypothetical protein